MPKASVLSYVATLIALLGLLWTAASKWQNLQDRVEHLEIESTYLHGHFTIPGAK